MTSRRRAAARKTAVEQLDDLINQITRSLALALICGLADELERSGRGSITVDELRLWAMDIDAEEPSS